MSLLNINNGLSYDDVITTSDESDIGYMVEVDLSCPKEIHELLKQFVPCPSTIIPTPAWFSGYQR